MSALVQGFPALPFLDEHWVLWDQACSDSLSGRGLGHEALIHATPLGWSGLSIIASMSFAALAIPVAEASATRSLRDAFGSASLSLSFVALPPGGDDRRCWAKRQATARRLARSDAFVLFAQEELAQSLCLSLSARCAPASFQFIGPHADRFNQPD